MEKNPNFPQFCDMRGMLSFYMLWLLNRNNMCGDDIAREIGKRRGEKPNPGTIYPALKKLKEAGLIKSQKRGRRIIYIITHEGRVELDKSVRYFLNAYGDIFRYYNEIWGDNITGLR